MSTTGVCVIMRTYLAISALKSSIHTRVLSRNEFFGGKMVRGKCTLDRGLGPSPQESVIVPLSEHIYLSVSTGRQELSLSHYFKLHLGKLFGGGSLSVSGRSFRPPPPSGLNPAYYE